MREWRERGERGEGEEGFVLWGEIGGGREEGAVGFVFVFVFIFIFVFVLKFVFIFRLGFFGEILGGKGTFGETVFGLCVDVVCVVGRGRGSGGGVVIFLAPHPNTKIPKLFLLF